MESLHKDYIKINFDKYIENSKINLKLKTMKLSKCLIFKVNNQKFAIRTNMVLNIVEKPKVIDTSSLSSHNRVMFSFRGVLIPLLNLKKVLCIQTNSININNCNSVLIVELKNNNKLELVGIAIDEIIEISEIDDILTYPYCSLSTEQKTNLRETVIIQKGEPIIVLNTNRYLLESYFEAPVEKPVSVLVN